MYKGVSLFGVLGLKAYDTARITLSHFSGTLAAVGLKSWMLFYGDYIDS